MRERRVTRAAVGRIAEGLSDRDKAVVMDVAGLRVLTGRQVERLHFAGLQGAHRDRTRRRVLERLVGMQLLATLERRIGGVRAGSAGLVYALGPAGQRLVSLETGQGFGDRTRQPDTPTDRFLGHSLAVAELYVELVEAHRARQFVLTAFRGEPDCWWRDSDGEWIKPDAVAAIGCGEIEDTWAIEVDRATESLPTLRRKLSGYLNLAVSGERGPQGGPLPRVLVTVPDTRRELAVRELVRSLPDPAGQLFAAALHADAVHFMARVLKE